MTRFGPGWRGRSLSEAEIVAQYGKDAVRPMPASFKKRTAYHEPPRAWHNWPLEYAKRMLARTGAQEWRERIKALTTQQVLRGSGLRFIARDEVHGMTDEDHGRPTANRSPAPSVTGRAATPRVDK